MADGTNRKNDKPKFIAKELYLIDDPKEEVVGERVLEKKVVRYVIVNLNDGTYLKYIPSVNNTSQVYPYRFFSDIGKATQVMDKLTAKAFVDSYQSATEDKCELYIIPVEITYELIKENAERATFSADDVFNSLGN